MDKLSLLTKINYDKDCYSLGNIKNKRKNDYTDDNDNDDDDNEYYRNLDNVEQLNYCWYSTIIISLVIHLIVFFIVVSILFNHMEKMKRLSEYWEMWYFYLVITVGFALIILTVYFYSKHHRKKTKNNNNISYDYLLNVSFIINEIMIIIIFDYIHYNDSEKTVNNENSLCLYVLFLILFIASFILCSPSLLYSFFSFMSLTLNFLFILIQVGLMITILLKRYEFSCYVNVNDWGLSMITICLIAYKEFNSFLREKNHKECMQLYKIKEEKLKSVIDMLNCPMISFEIPTMNKEMNKTMRMLYENDSLKKRNDKWDESIGFIENDVKEMIRALIKKYNCDSSNNMITSMIINDEKLNIFCEWLTFFTIFRSIPGDNIKEENNIGTNKNDVLISKIINAISNEPYSISPISLGNYFIELPQLKHPTTSYTSNLKLGEIIVKPSTRTINYSYSSINPNILNPHPQPNNSSTTTDYSNYLFFSLHLLKTKTINGQSSIDIILKDIKPEIIIEKTKEQMKSKVTFLAQIAHEFKTPLIIVSHVIKDLSGCKTINEEKFNTIYSMAEYSLSLITDITDYSRQYHNYEMEFSFEEVDIINVIDFAFSILRALISCHDAKSGHIIPSKFIGKNIGKIKTDKKRLQQVLINLFNNAFKFTNAGSIILKVNHTPSYLYDKSNLRQKYYVEHNRSYTFTIEDTGIGIKSGNNSNKIFQEYHIEDNIETKRNNQTGSGLGLSIVKKIVAKLGDEISYTTVAHHGTSFHFNIFDYDQEFEDNQIKYGFNEKENHFNQCNSNLNNNTINNRESDPNKIMLYIKSGGHITTPNLHHSKAFWKKHPQSAGSDNLIMHNDQKKNTQNLFKRQTEFIRPPQFRNSAYIEMKYSSKFSRNKSCFYSSENKHIPSKTSNQPNSTYSNIKDESNNNYKRSQMLFEQQDIINSPFHFNDSDQSDSYSADSDSNNSSSTISLKNIFLATNNLFVNSNKISYEESFSITNIIDFPINFHQSKNKVSDYISIIENTKSDLILIVEDNRIMRKSLTKNINQSVSNNNLNMQIIGFADGFELLYAVYYDQLIGKRIKFIFSDESMHMLNGLESYRILQGNCKIDLSYLNFFVISSYNWNDLTDINNCNVQILNKPVRKEIFDSIFETYANSLSC